jgi:Fur family zinc uptake transcriptional regulator
VAKEFDGRRPEFAKLTRPASAGGQTEAGHDEQRAKSRTAKAGKPPVAKPSAAPKKAEAKTEPKVDPKAVREARLVPPKFEPKGRPAGLTKNEKLLWDVLSTQSGPLKAYEILDLLKEKGVRAPMTVYRALDGLEEKGVIHKLDAMKAFVRCNHEGPHEVQAFLVCEICSFVKEIEIDAMATGIAPIVRRAGFDLHVARLEVRGVCDNCFCDKHNHGAAGGGQKHDHAHDHAHDHDHPDH